MLELDPKFRAMVERVIKYCRQQGYELVPFFTLRDVHVQAKLWRQSRTTAQIREAIESLKNRDAPFLANVLDEVGPQNGQQVTNALPGFSWHQWGLAVDCFVREEGKAIWNSSHEGYKIYAKTARNLGLTAGLYWKSKDAVHIQEPSKSPQINHTTAEIDKKMQERFAAPFDRLAFEKSNPQLFRRRPLPVRAIQADRTCTLITTHGPVTAISGAMIVEDVGGELYPCAVKTFQNIYEAELN